MLSGEGGINSMSLCPSPSLTPCIASSGVCLFMWPQPITPALEPALHAMKPPESRVAEATAPTSQSLP